MYGLIFLKEIGIIWLADGLKFFMVYAYRIGNEVKIIVFCLVN